MPREIQFGSKDAADTYREEFPNSICSDDDARLKTITFASSAPDWLLEQAELEALETRGEREASTGQVGLTDHECDEVDFSKDRASVPHARAVKAIARDKGVDDWLAYYDPTITVEEHHGTMERARSEGGGRRMDAGEERMAERRRDAARAAQSSQCDHARGHCEHGDPEACEFLRNACDYSGEEIEEILAEDQDDVDGEREIEGKGWKYRLKLFVEWCEGERSRTSRRGNHPGLDVPRHAAVSSLTLPARQGARHLRLDEVLPGEQVPILEAPPPDPDGIDYLAAEHRDPARGRRGAGQRQHRHDPGSLRPRID